MVTATQDPIRILADALAPILRQKSAQEYGINPYRMGEKHDSAGNPIEVGYMHGPGGLLTFPGVDPVVFNNQVGITSILGQLPALPSVFTNPTFLTLTGVGDDEGSEKDDVCDDAPVSGLLSGCLLTSVFGRYERATPELEINRLGQRNDRSDPLDLTLVNSPMASTGIFNSGVQSTATPADVLVNEVSAKFWERNLSLHRLLARQLWTGNPANNSAGGGYKEMTGFSVLVNTGHVDAETNAACASMDSFIMNYNYGRVDDSNSDIVAKFVAMYHQLYRKAELTGILPVRWVVAMRSQLFYEMTAIWPCSYLAYRCTTSPQADGLTINVNAQDAIAMRDAMRAGRYLMVDGVRLDVVIDDGIPEFSQTDNGNVASGCFSSDIYFIPMSVAGGRAVTYLEYFQYNNPSIQDALGNMILGRIEGAFLTWPRQRNQCIQWQTKVEPRLVMRTPWLAGRIQNVMYCPVQHEPTAFPGDPYYSGGDGVNTRQGPSLYSMWQS